MEIKIANTPSRQEVLAQRNAKALLNSHRAAVWRSPIKPLLRSLIPSLILGA